MKLKYYALAFSMFSILHQSYSFADDAPSDTHSLAVKVNNIKSKDGQIICNLFKKGDDILHEPSIQKKIPINAAKEVDVIFDNLPYGHYVVFAFQDENSNGTLDHNMIGIPNEPMGYSNNWNFGLFTGMPTFEKTEIYFSEKRNSISIKLD